MTAASHQQYHKYIEQSLQLELPFDSEVLSYLLRCVPQSSENELLELVGDFCPRWTQKDHQSLARLLQEYEQGGTGGQSNVNDRILTSTAKTIPTSWQDDARRSSVQMDGKSAAERELAADAMLAQMLQDEEDGEFGGGIYSSRNGARAAGGKKGKKSFKPLNVNYTVGRGAAPILGTAAPSQLAETLRARRQQQATPLALQPEHFGPSANRGGSAWAPPPQESAGGLSWAERAQLGQEQAEAAERRAAQELAAEAARAAAAPVAAVRPATVQPGSMTLKLGTSNGTEYSVSVNPNDTIGDIKARVEKLHSIAAGQQRILHMGRELPDRSDVQSLGLRHNQLLQLAVRIGGATQARAEPPRPAVSAAVRAADTFAARVAGAQSEAAPGVPVMTLTLKLPDGMSVLMHGVSETARVAELKQMIQQEHGIRAEHIQLTFYGCMLPDASKLADCGVASRASLEVLLRPPGVPADLYGGDPEELAVSAAAQAAMSASAEPSAPSKAKRKRNKKGGGQEEAMDPLPQRAAQQQQPQQSTAAQRAAPALQPPRPAPMPAAGARAGLVNQVFRLCDANGDGYLTEEELKTFAQGTGFEGGDDEWADEYLRFCSDTKADPSRGIDKGIFARLIDDQSDDGCYCTDAELRTLVASLRDKARKAAEAPAAAPAAAPTTIASSGDSERAGLIKRLFAAIDKDGDGVLSREELRAFATAQGFDGSDSDWQGEYDTLCRDHKCVGRGLGEAEFTVLVNDESDDGCYCTNDELKAYAEQLAKRPAPPAFAPPPPTASTASTATTSRAVATPPVAPPLPPPTRPETASERSAPSATTSSKRPPAPLPPPPPPLPRMSPERRRLLTTLFDRLDVDGDGVLSCEEMQKFGTLSGFDGDEAEWKEEYDRVCADVGEVTEAAITKLVNDESDDGIYLTDEQMQNMLNELGEKPKVKMTRTALISAVFHAMDLDNDNLLSCDEMYQFAQLTLFDGGPEAWAREYAEVCRDNGIPVGAVTLAVLAKLVNDDSDNGCYCDDEQLQYMLEQAKERRRRAAEASPADEQAESDAEDIQDGGAEEETPAAAVVASVTSFASARPPPGLPAPPGLSLPSAEERLVAARPEAPPAPLSRDALIRSLFLACDADGDSRLNSAEMRVVASGIGFQGTDSEWAEEFAALMADSGRDVSEGIDLELFMKLINDESDSGCYCTDEELGILIKRRQGNARGGR